jgi:hypothetical protein
MWIDACALQIELAIMTISEIEAQTARYPMHPL